MIMKKTILSFLFLFFFVSSVSATTSYVSKTENGHAYKVMKVVLDGKSKIVVGVAPNYTPAKSLKTLMEDMWWTHAINGGFFCPDEAAYSRCNRGTSDLIRISNWTLYSVWWKHVWPYRAVFGFDSDWEVLPLATNDDKYYQWWQRENKNLDTMTNGIMMPMLVKNWVNVAVLFDEMNNDPKQGKASNKTFICSTQDNSTIYMWYVDGVTFSSLADYIITTFGCYNAIQLDNGWTKAMVYNNSYVAWPGRSMRDAFIIVEWDGWAVVTPTDSAASYTTEELQTAITWMYNQWLTMYNTIEKFLPNNNMTREEASKFFSVFAKKEFKKTEIAGMSCSFYDIKKADPTLVSSITGACNLGIFKWYKWYFTPLDRLTNAQAITVLMRIIVGQMEEPTNAFYMNYLLKAKEFDLIGNVDMSVNITRWEAAILLYKAHLYREKNIIIEDEDDVVEDINTISTIEGTQTNSNSNEVDGSFDYDICRTPNFILACALWLSSCPAECLDTYNYSSSTSSENWNDSDYSVCYDNNIIPACVAQTNACPSICLDNFTYTSTTTYNPDTNTTTTVNHISSK